MNTERFLAKGVTKSTQQNFTSVILKIAITAIALSMIVMIVTTSMIRGFKNQITDKIFGFWGHIHIYDNNISRSFEAIPIDISDVFYEDLKSLEHVSFQKQAELMGVSLEGKFTESKTNGGIRHVQTFTILPGIMTTKTNMEGVFAKGVGADFDWEGMQEFLIEGERLQFGEAASNKSIISKAVSKRLKLKLGDKFNLRFWVNDREVKRQFVVGGIYNTGLEEYDKKFILVDQYKLTQVLGWDSQQVGGVEVFVDDLDDMEAISEFMYYDIIPANLYSQTVKDKFSNIFDWLEFQDINELVILLLMIIVSIINMITALLILILERTKMIGTLKALGMRNWGIRKIFMHHASYIIIRGLLIGTVVGLLICFLQLHFGFITLDEKAYYLSVAPIEIHWPTIIIINVLTFVVTLIFLILPTYLVTRISPIKALRFD